MYQLFTTCKKNFSFLLSFMLCFCIFKNGFSWGINCVCLNCTIRWTFVIVYAHETPPTTINIVHFHYLLKDSVCPSVVCFFPLPLAWGNHWSALDYSVFSRISYKWNFHINEIHDVFSCVVFFTMILGFMRIVACINSLFLLLLSSSMWIYYILLVHSPVFGLGLLLFWGLL